MKLPFALCAALTTIFSAIASCAVSANAPAKQSPSSRLIALTNATGHLSLRAPVDQIGPFELRAFGDTQLQSEFTSPSGGVLPWLRIGSQSLPPLPVDSSTTAMLKKSNDWQYVLLNGALSSNAPLTSVRRHTLLVEPDLAVVLDEFVLSNSTSITVNLPSRSAPHHDTLRDEWTTESERARLVARILSLPKSTQSWTSSSETNGAGHLTSTVAESGREFHHLTIFAIQTNGIRRSLAFKLLESDTAIGARIHRDGLPTLLAFRKASCSGEANLTGLKFTAPVAVDIFHPKPRPQRNR